MYDKQLWIDPKVYPFLLRWGLSTGFEIETNEPHTLLMRIACFDPFLVRELEADGKKTSLSWEEAGDLVNDLSVHIDSHKLIYNPSYFPILKIPDDFSNDIFLPKIREGGEYEVDYEQWGIYHKINRVGKTVVPTGRPGEDIIAGEVLSRNGVAALIREMEYEGVMRPFAITYNLLRERGPLSTTIRFDSAEFETYEKTYDRMRIEMERRVPADWRIYEDVTHLADRVTFMPALYNRCEGWLWLRVFHKNREGLIGGGDYWEEGFFEDLADLTNAMIRIKEENFFAIFGIYACKHRTPPPEEPKKKAHKVGGN